ncbi:hypothetical protein I317_07629 [Kwoniella heveanensis CBS 569]|uniref:HPt domain-containing protein n=1 Tax=Kwoniella heveanensis BCC8398 TaxID=1296120 RepID=A0A1B9GJH7_9TREE|nr:hypothetical protein I316_07249 [Kwoniella heveanensis BCC8398]OCF38601.1 hypothetical protein I317_07629 [Kwoniella heveanensis CBS 569]
MSDTIKDQKTSTSSPSEPAPAASASASASSSDAIKTAHVESESAASAGGPGLSTSDPQDLKDKELIARGEKKDDVPAENDDDEDPSVDSVPQEEVIDMETFQQIMDMDEDDGDDDEDGDKHAFSRGIVWGYFEQAEATFTEMEDAIVAEDLAKLSSLGHFLKGSSAALGIIKVQASCEKMQHYGNKRDEEAGIELESAEALKRIKNLLTSCKKDYRIAKKWMEKLYEEDN